MGEMSINLGKTEQIARKIAVFGPELRDYSARIHQISVKLRRNQSTSMDFLCDKINLQNEEVIREAEKMNRLYDSLSSIVAKYGETEDKIVGAGNRVRIVYAVPLIENIKPFQKIDVNYKSFAASSSNKWEETLENLKAVLKSLDNAGDVSEAGVLEDSISYIESLIGFLTGDKKGITGASDWFDLSDSSIGVWTKLYEYCKEKYENVNAGIFSNIVERKVAVVGVASGFLALISSALSAKDKGKVADYIECGNDVLSIIKADYKLKHIGDTKSLSKIKAGVWSAMDIYTAVGKAGVRAVKQAVQSYEKYSADGHWSIADTGAAGIDVAMAGIYGLAHEFTYGIDNLIYGTVDKLSGGHYDPDMDYAQKAAAGLRIKAEEVGEKVGNWLNNLIK